MQKWYQNGRKVTSNGQGIFCNECPCIPIEITINTSGIRRFIYGNSGSAGGYYSDSEGNNVWWDYPTGGSGTIQEICDEANDIFFNTASDYTLTGNLTREYLSTEYDLPSQASNNNTYHYYLKEIYISHNSMYTRIIKTTIKKYDYTEPIEDAIILAEYTDEIASGETKVYNDPSVFLPIEAPPVEPRTSKYFRENYIIECEVL